MDPFKAKDVIDTNQGHVAIYRLSRLEEMGLGTISRFPYSIKIYYVQRLGGKTARINPVIPADVVFDPAHYFHIQSQKPNSLHCPYQGK